MFPYRGIIEMNIPFTLDTFDVQILRELQEHGRMSSQKLADKLGLSPTPCWRRVRALQKENVILGYHAHIDPEKVGLPVMVLVSITLEQKTRKALQDFETKVSEIPEVLECYEMSGQADYLLKVVAASIRDFREFLVETLIGGVPGISATESSFVLQVVKSNSVLPIKITPDAQV
jgi:Lrp/AsnC family transcriptional regulator, leucine-responsive regulatory protein